MPNVSGPIRTFGESDVYSTGDANRQSLGFHSVNSLAERNAIPLARRRGNYELFEADAEPKPFFCSVRVGLDVTLYWLKNEPGTATTTDSDWEQFVATVEEPFQGFFDAAVDPDNTIFTDGIGIKGQYWITTTAGTYNSIVFDAYDNAKYNGTVWVKVGGASAVADWNTMLNKPTVFPPENHFHEMSDINGLGTALGNKLNVGNVEQTVSGLTTLVPSSKALVEYAYSKEAINQSFANLSTLGITYSFANLADQNLQTSQNPPSTNDLALRVDEQKVYKWNGVLWEFHFALNTAGAALTETVESKVNVGNIVIGQVISIGTLFTEFVKQLVVKITNPTYTQPTGSISTSQTLSVEVGTNITPIINAVYNDGDSGGIDRYQLYRNSIQVVDSATFSPDPIFDYADTTQTVSTTVIYEAFMHFVAGVVKYDDDTPPQPYPIGQIGDTWITTNTLTITGYRNLFYDCSKAATTSAEIRTWTNSSLNPQNGTQFTINIPLGATSIEFAYPDSLQDVTTVFDTGSNLDIKSAFTLTTVNVEGAAGYTGVDYKVYKFEPVAAFSQPNQYIITI